MKKNIDSPALPCSTWWLLSSVNLTWWDKVRLLLGWRLYVRFESPNGKCSAGCEHSWAVARDKYVHPKLDWRWGNNWPHPKAGPADFSGFVKLCLVFALLLTGCADLRPDYSRKLSAEKAELQKRWDALDAQSTNHAEEVRLYDYQCGYVAGMEDSAK